MYLSINTLFLGWASKSSTVILCMVQMEASANLDELLSLGHSEVKPLVEEVEVSGRVFEVQEEGCFKLSEMSES